MKLEINLENIFNNSTIGTQFVVTVFKSFNIALYFNAPVLK